MKVWVIAAILLVNIIVQSTVFPFLQIVGVKPDTLMALVVSFALLAGSVTGVVVGFFGGLLQDMLYGGTLGFNAFQYMLIGFFLGLVHHRVFIGKVVLPIFFAFLGVLMRGLLMMIYLFFMRVDIPSLQGFTVIVLPEAIYTSALMPLIFYLMTLLYQRKFMTKKWHFKRR